MNKNILRCFQIFTLFVIAHLSLLAKSYFNIIGILIVTFCACFLVLISMFKRYMDFDKAILFVIVALFSAQFTHVVLQEVNFPFCYVGMYSNIEREPIKSISTRNLYDKNGNMVTSNSGLIFSEFDDTESKLITRLLKKNDPKIDSAIVDMYKVYFIQ